MIFDLGTFKGETHLVNIKAETHLSKPSTGSRFSLPALPGYSASLFDDLVAANTIISSGRQDQVIGGLLKTGSQGMQASVVGVR